MFLMACQTCRTLVETSSHLRLTVFTTDDTTPRIHSMTFWTTPQTKFHTVVTAAR